MSHPRALLSALIAPLLFSFGCIAGNYDEIDEGVVGSEAELSGNHDHSRIVTNGLSSGYLLSNRGALIDLAGRALSPLAIAKSPLMKEPEGRALLEYVIKCAFGWDAAIHVPYAQKSIVFEGEVGLAEPWATGTLSPSGQRWITACLLAHANAYGARVPLSLRGDHPNLAMTQEEAQTYTVEEGAYYGNLFDRSTEKQSAFACWGKSAADPCASSQSKWLEDRVCAVGNASVSACGFFVAGSCFEPEQGALHACDKDGANGYSDCHSAAIEAPSSVLRHGKGAGYSEVITVFLRDDPKPMALVECSSL